MSSTKRYVVRRRRPLEGRPERNRVVVRRSMRGAVQAYTSDKETLQSSILLPPLKRPGENTETPTQNVRVSQWDRLGAHSTADLSSSSRSIASDASGLSGPSEEEKKISSSVNSGSRSAFLGQGTMLHAQPVHTRDSFIVSQQGDRRERQETLKHMIYSERVRETYHSRVLKKWQKQQAVWQDTEERLSEATGRPRGQQLSRAAAEHRVRREEMDRIDRALPPNERYSRQFWARTLRESMLEDEIGKQIREKNSEFGRLSGPTKQAERPSQSIHPDAAANAGDADFLVPDIPASYVPFASKESKKTKLDPSGRPLLIRARKPQRDVLPAGVPGERIIVPGGAKSTPQPHTDAQRYEHQPKSWKTSVYLKSKQRRLRKRMHALDGVRAAGADEMRLSFIQGVSLFDEETPDALQLTSEPTPTEIATTSHVEKSSTNIKTVEVDSACPDELVFELQLCMEDSLSTHASVSPSAPVRKSSVNQQPSLRLNRLAGFAYAVLNPSRTEARPSDPFTGDDRRRTLVTVWNTGSAIVRVRWERITDFPVAPSKSQGEPAFTCDLDCVSLLPGQRHTFEFIFQPPHAGLFVDRWVLRCSPSLDNQGACWEVIESGPFSVTDTGEPVLVLRGSAELPNEGSSTFEHSVLANSLGMQLLSTQKRAADGDLTRGTQINLRELIASPHLDGSWTQDFTSLCRRVLHPRVMRLQVPPATPLPPPWEFPRVFAGLNRRWCVHYSPSVFDGLQKLACDIFGHHRKLIRMCARWDFTLDSLLQWIDRIPERERGAIPELRSRWTSLLLQAQVRPALTKTNYQLMRQILVANVSSQIERVGTLINAQLRTDFSLPEDVAVQKRRAERAYIQKLKRTDPYAAYQLEMKEKRAQMGARTAPAPAPISSPAPSASSKTGGRRTANRKGAAEPVEPPVEVVKVPADEVAKEVADALEGDRQGRERVGHDSMYAFIKSQLWQSVALFSATAELPRPDSRSCVWECPENTEPAIVSDELKEQRKRRAILQDYLSPFGAKEVEEVEVEEVHATEGGHLIWWGGGGSGAAGEFAPRVPSWMPTESKEAKEEQPAMMPTMTMRSMNSRKSAASDTEPPAAALEKKSVKVLSCSMGPTHSVVAVNEDGVRKVLCWPSGSGESRMQYAPFDPISTVGKPAESKDTDASSSEHPSSDRRSKRSTGDTSRRRAGKSSKRGAGLSHGSGADGKPVVDWAEPTQPVLPFSSFVQQLTHQGKSLSKCSYLEPWELRVFRGMSIAQVVAGRNLTAVVTQQGELYTVEHWATGVHINAPVVAFGIPGYSVEGQDWCNQVGRDVRRSIATALTSATAEPGSAESAGNSPTNSRPNSRSSRRQSSTQVVNLEDALDSADSSVYGGPVPADAEFWTTPARQVMAVNPAIPSNEPSSNATGTTATSNATANDRMNTLPVSITIQKKCDSEEEFEAPPAAHTLGVALVNKTVFNSAVPASRFLIDDAAERWGVSESYVKRLPSIVAGGSQPRSSRASKRSTTRKSLDSEAVSSMQYGSEIVQDLTTGGLNESTMMSLKESVENVIEASEQPSDLPSWASSSVLDGFNAESPVQRLAVLSSVLNFGVGSGVPGIFPHTISDWASHSRFARGLNGILTSFPRALGLRSGSQFSCQHRETVSVADTDGEKTSRSSRKSSSRHQRTSTQKAASGPLVQTWDGSKSLVPEGEALWPVMIQDGVPAVPLSAQVTAFAAASMLKQYRSGLSAPSTGLVRRGGGFSSIVTAPEQIADAESKENGDVALKCDLPSGMENFQDAHSQCGVIIRHAPGLFIKQTQVGPTSGPDAGHDGMLILDALGRVWGVGRNAHGVLGVGDKLPRFKPTLLSGALDGKRIVDLQWGGGSVVMALSDEGEVFVWGAPDSGCLKSHHPLGAAVKLNGEPVHPSPAVGGWVGAGEVSYQTLAKQSTSVDEEANLDSGSISVASSPEDEKETRRPKGSSPTNTSESGRMIPLQVRFPSAGGSRGPSATSRRSRTRGTSEDVDSSIGSPRGRTTDSQEESPRILAIACGVSHCVALSIDGEVFTWGRGAHGVLGHGDTKDVDAPRRVNSIGTRRDLPIMSVACGGRHTLAVCGTTREVFVWGWGGGGSGGDRDQKSQEGSLGLGKDSDAYVATPRVVSSLQSLREKDRIVRVVGSSAGGSFSGVWVK